MSRRCEICDKGTMTGMSISHSHIKNKKNGPLIYKGLGQWLMVHQKRLTVCTVVCVQESYKSYLKQKQAYRACFLFLSFAYKLF